MQDSVSSINTTLSNIASTMSDTSTAAKTYVDNLSEQYDNSSKTLSESLGSSQIPSGIKPGSAAVHE